MEYQRKKIGEAEVIDVINKSIFAARMSEKNRGASLAHTYITWDGKSPNVYVGNEVIIQLEFYSFGGGGRFSETIRTEMFLENFGDTAFIYAVNGLLNTCK